MSRKTTSDAIEQAQRMKEIGQRIYNIRKSRRLVVDDVASGLAIGGTAYKCIEAGLTNNVHIHTFYDIARELRCEVVDFFTDDLEPSESEDVDSRTQAKRPRYGESLKLGQEERNNLAFNLRRLLDDRYVRSQFAQNLGVSVQHVATIMNQTNKRTNESHVEAMAQYLGVTPEWLTQEKHMTIRPIDRSAAKEGKQPLVVEEEEPVPPQAFPPRRVRATLSQSVRDDQEFDDDEAADRAQQLPDDEYERIRQRNRQRTLERQRSQGDTD